MSVATRSYNTDCLLLATLLPLQFTTPLELELLSEIKEKLCFIQQNTKDKPKETSPESYLLPDESVVRLSSERHSIPEAIFSPTDKLGLEQPGLHNCCFKSIMKTNTEIRPEMFKNIVLAGGNTLFENFKQRLQHEIFQLAPTKTAIEVVENKERMYSSWIGGSIIGNMDTFQYLCISRKDYEEHGSKIVHDKTF